MSSVVMSRLVLSWGHEMDGQGGTIRHRQDPAKCLLVVFGKFAIYRGTYTYASLFNGASIREHYFS